MISQNENAKKALQEGVNLIANIVKETLGPKGRNIILYNDNEEAFVTKDGISVARKISSTLPDVEAAIQIMREASAKTANQAGDGSTTSLILAQAIFNYGLEMLDRGENVVTIRKDLMKGLDIIHSHLSEYSKVVDFTYEALKYVATTSANNDKEVGDIVANAFVQVGRDGTVLFDKEEDAVRTYTEIIKGSQFRLGIAAKEFYNNDAKQVAYYENPYVLIINNEVKSLADVRPALKIAVNDKRPIVIFATDFSPNALQQFYMNLMKGTLEIIPIRVTGYAGNRRDTMQDLASLTGADVYDICPQGIEPRMGTCDNITSSLTHTIIIQNNPSEDYFIKLNSLSEMIENEKDGAIKELMINRLSQLKGRIAVIHVGGRTEVEAKERYDRVEDSICAVKAALEEGVSAGGGLTYMRLAEKFTDIPEIMRAALLEPFKQLCRNADVDEESIRQSILSNSDEEVGYNFLTDTIENMYSAGIIDPTKVIRLAIENAASVAMMLLTTSSVIYHE